MAVTDRLTTHAAGRWQDPERRVDATGTADAPVVGSIGYGGSREAPAAVDPAAGACDRWPNTTARDRADLLRAAAGLLTERVDAIDATDAIDAIGLPLAEEPGRRPPEARREADSAAGHLRRCAEEARRTERQAVANGQTDRRRLTLRRPSGAAPSPTPWHLPAFGHPGKPAPTLAAGRADEPRASLRDAARVGAVQGVVDAAWGAGARVAFAPVCGVGRRGSRLRDAARVGAVQGVVDAAWRVGARVALAPVRGAGRGGVRHGPGESVEARCSALGGVA
jgi:succinate-semialdehyde dehydrogenase/glutarate-semialdehyde dehydrogenase